MYRGRRRRNREIAFSLDSFLDVITNLIGIVIRMILVVWVGARSYHEVQNQLHLLRNTPPAVAATPATEITKIVDPLEAEIAKQRQALDKAQNTLLDELRQLPPLDAKRADLEKQLAALAAEGQALLHGGDQVTAATAQQDQVTRNVSVSMDDVARRSDKLRQDIAKLQLLPVAKKTIQYRTPVSRPVVTEELFFECRNGRVAFVDFGAMQQEMNDDLQNRKKELLDSGKIDGVTRQIGSFRLRYVVRTNSAGAIGGRVEVTGSGAVEPMAAIRGETLTQALQPTSEFRQIADFIDAKQSVVTFWVYPDSFALFRQLRDYLYQRDIEVAARPLPYGASIAFGPDGTASRSQ